MFILSLSPMAASTPPASSSPTAPDPLARQNALLKKAIGALVLLLVLGAGAFVFVRHQGQPVSILLDGKAVATARNARAAEELLKAAEQARVGAAYPPDSIVRLQKVQLVRVPDGTPLDPTDSAQARLRNALKLHVRSYAIFVNGKAALGLPSDSAAADTLHRVKEHFAQMGPQTDVIHEPAFGQRVAVKEAALDAGQTRPDAASAASYFWTAPPSRTYVIRRHDSGMSIARRSHLSLSDLIAANSGMDINRLKPGTSINVQKMPLLLTVEVQKRLTREEKIIPNVPDADAGLRSVTYAVTYINGQETRKDVLSMSTITPPKIRTAL